MPLDSVFGLVLEHTAGVTAIGWATSARINPNGADTLPLAVARSSNDGASCHASELPCRPGPALQREVWERGYLAGDGEDLVAVCASVGGGGANPTEVVVSRDGGASRSERCGNGVFGIANKLGRCPAYGDPQAVAVLPDGVEVLSQFEVGILVSTDNGATWSSPTTSALPVGWPEVELSASSRLLWALEYGPVVAPGRQRLAWTTDGLHWHMAALPSAGSPA
jgi:hypothetical protein